MGAGDSKKAGNHCTKTTANGVNVCTRSDSRRINGVHGDWFDKTIAEGNVTGKRSSCANHSRRLTCGPAFHCCARSKCRNGRTRVSRVRCKTLSRLNQITNHYDVSGPFSTMRRILTLYNTGVGAMKTRTCRSIGSAGGQCKDRAYI